MNDITSFLLLENLSFLAVSKITPCLLTESWNLCFLQNLCFLYVGEIIACLVIELDLVFPVC